MSYTQREIITTITPLLEGYPVKRAALFGSYARNEQTPGSDVDLLLDLGVNAANPSVDYVFDLLSLIEDKINLQVDYLTVRGLQTNPSAQFKSSVEKESWWFYEA